MYVKLQRLMRIELQRLMRIDTALVGLQLVMVNKL